jgi:hypothetical protein
MKTYTLRDARRICSKALRGGFNNYVLTDVDYAETTGLNTGRYLHVPVASERSGHPTRPWLNNNVQLATVIKWLDEQIRLEGGSSPALPPDTNNDQGSSEQGQDDQKGGDKEKNVNREGSDGESLPDLDSTWGPSPSAGGEETKSAKTCSNLSGGNATGGEPGMATDNAGRTRNQAVSPSRGEPSSQAPEVGGNQSLTPHHANNAESSLDRENAVACGFETAEHGEEREWPNLNLTSPGGDLTGDSFQDIQHSEGQYSSAANAGRAGSVIDERAVREAAGAHSGGARKMSEALDGLFKRLNEVSTGIETSQRINGSRLARELVSKSLRMSRTRKEEMARRLTVVAVDVSPSCAAIASLATAAGIALCKADPTVVLIVHSNGFIESISGQRQSELGLQKRNEYEGSYSSAYADWAKFTPQKVAGIVVWGDTDAVEAYGIAAEETPVFWLDPSEPRSVLPTKEYASYRGVSKIKTYVAGVDDAKKAVEAIRKCKF